MERDQQRDDFIRNLVRQQVPDQAPEGFTGRVMEKIQPETVPAHEPILSPATWAGIFIGIAALIVVMFVVDIPFISNFFSSTGIQRISLGVFSGNFYDSFIQFFKDLNVTAIGIAIVIGFIALVLLERIISRKKEAQGLVLL